MKNKMEIKIIFLILITVVIIVVSLSILATISGISTTFPDYLRNFVEGVYSSIFGKPYNICEAYKDKLISYGEFKTILIALKQNACKDEHAIVRLSFSLSKEDLKKLPEEIKISKSELVFFKEAEPFGVGGIIIKGNPGEYPLRMFDTVEIWTEGIPEKDILIKVTAKGCDPFDDVCDLACSYKRGVCDRECYKHGKKEDVVCDIDCVDINGDGKIDEEDFDNICDLDCYNNITNPERVYDPDCAKIKVVNPDLASSYGILGFCDPDSNGIRDGICDPDCAQRNYICDPDCDGNITEGNPNGYLDDDCYVCDKICNGFCSMNCKASDKDPDCPLGFKGWNELEECCGNGVCGNNESCESCKDDCPLGNTCEDFGKICCPISADKDEYGCTSKKNLSEGEECSCNNQCSGNLTCDKTGHCCYGGTEWNGTECIKIERYDIIFVPIGYSANDFEEFKYAAETAFKIFVDRSPFKECKDPENRVAMHLVHPNDCRGSCSQICHDCTRLALNCARSSEYWKDADMVAALCKGNSCPGACGCANGIPGTASASNMAPCRGVLYEIPTHEMGHSFGLGHIDCNVACHACMINNPNCPDCGHPERASFVMDYCNGMHRFGPAAYKYLKEKVFKKYLDGC